MKKINAIIVATIILAVTADPVLAFAPNDPYFSEQWYLSKIDAVEAWETTQGSSEIVIALLDTGLDLNHPDLAGNVWVNADEIAGDGKDNDNNGYIDDVNGWDFVSDDAMPAPEPEDPFAEDAVAHGTALAGVLGAIGDNSEGIAGIAWNTRIMSVRILDNFGSGTSADATKAVRYAVANGADIINLSFTGTEVDSVFKDAVHDAYSAGVVVIAAVGNTPDGGKDTDDEPIYPACFMGEDGEDWVLGVAASTQDDTKAGFSNYGSDCTDLSAPGDGIFSTMYENEDWNGFDDFYLGGWSGTSIAAPMVAGATALLLATYPSLSVADVKVVLQLSADPMQEHGTDATGELGAGRVNIARALEIASEFVVDAPVPPPSDEEAGVTRDAHGHRVAPPSGEFAPSPVTGKMESVSVVYTGWFIRSPSFDTIYYVDENMDRRPFWDAQTYFTWADAWDDTIWVTDATLSTLELAAPLVPKSGVVLVKIQSDPSVYAVEEGADPKSPVLRRIVSEEIAEKMYFDTWADFVLDIEPTLLNRYQHGEDISAPEPIDTTIMRSRNEIQVLIAGAGE